MTGIPNKLLSDLLLSPVLPYNEKSANGALQITAIHPAGDVVHVFSHIKKTYRTQWVILEGGENPPSLNEQLGKHQERENQMDVSDELHASSGPMWTKLEDVSNAKYVACW